MTKYPRKSEYQFFKGDLDLALDRAGQVRSLLTFISGQISQWLPLVLGKVKPWLFLVFADGAGINCVEFLVSNRRPIWHLVNCGVRFDMEEKRVPTLPETKNQSSEVALDSLNAELRAKRNKAVSSRRLMEASIESKARKRRKSEGPGSSLLKSKSPG